MGRPKIEKKVCSVCGENLPLSAFRSWQNKDGEVRYFHKCTKCVNKEQRARAKMDKISQALMKFSDEAILNEVERRKLINQ